MLCLCEQASKIQSKFLMDNSSQAVSVFNKLAQQYQDRFMNFDLYNDTFDIFCDNIPKPDAAILELACGPGNITRYLLNKRPDFKILGTDLAPNMLELAKENNPAADFQIMDSRAIASIDKKYDGIMIGFCLPYLSKEETAKLISDAYQILNPEGVIYISTMEDDYSKSGIEESSNGDTVFVHYYLAGDILQMLKANHFNIINLQRKDFLQKDNTIAKHLVIIAKK